MFRKFKPEFVDNYFILSDSIIFLKIDQIIEENINDRRNDPFPCKLSFTVEFKEGRNYRFARNKSPKRGYLCEFIFLRAEIAG